MSAVEKQLHYLKLRLDEQIILISLSQIHMVLPIAEVQTVPGSDTALQGILNFHGQALSIYHLSELINTTKPHYDLNTPLLIAVLPLGLFGFLVSEIFDVIEISEENIQCIPSNKAVSYMKGLIETEQWSGWILDLQKLLTLHQSRLEKDDE